MSDGESAVEKILHQKVSIVKLILSMVTPVASSEDFCEARHTAEKKIFHEQFWLEISWGCFTQPPSPFENEKLGTSLLHLI